MRFIADSMLGRLARWLRILGHDVLYDPYAADDDLIEQAISDSRILLTRDTLMLRRRRLPAILFIRHDALEEQLRQVYDDLHISAEETKFLTRCAECNGTLEKATRESVRGSVPPHIFERHERFVRCPDCHRVYWAGSHLPHLRDRLRRLLGEERFSGEEPER